MHRYISALLIAGMLMSTGVPALAVETSALNEAHYSLCSVSLNTSDHVQYLQGNGAKVFNPENHLTRAQVAQTIYNLLSTNEVEITASSPEKPTRQPSTIISVLTATMI